MHSSCQKPSDDFCCGLRTASLSFTAFIASATLVEAVLTCFQVAGPGLACPFDHTEITPPYSREGSMRSHAHSAKLPKVLRVIPFSLQKLTLSH